MEEIRITMIGSALKQAYDMIGNKTQDKIRDVFNVERPKIISPLVAPHRQMTDGFQHYKDYNRTVESATRQQNIGRPQAQAPITFATSTPSPTRMPVQPVSQMKQLSAAPQAPVKSGGNIFESLLRSIGILKDDVITSNPTRRVVAGEKTIAPQKFAPEVQDAIARIRKYKPEVKLSDEKIAEMYKANGPRLMDQIPALQPTPVPGISISPKVEEFLTNVALPITRKYNLPDAVVAGMLGAEGRLEGLGASRNNFFNIAAFDSNVQAAFRYGTPEQGVEAYAKYLTGELKNDKGRYLYPSEELRQKIKRAHETFKKTGDVQQYVVDIQNNGYAGDPKTWRRRKLEQDGVPTPYQSYSDFVTNIPEFKRFNY